MARADKITQLAFQKESFSDFLDNFDIHPVNGAVGRIINENAVRQSIKNIIMTNLGERLFQSRIGSDIYRSLFEPLDQVTANIIVQAVKSSIKYNEPRAKVLEVGVFKTSDENAVMVKIVFSLINKTDASTVEVVLKRVR
jgi:phage baseplate assembly protein W